MSRIFLSHSSANNGPAVALRDWLKAEGWDDVFLDLDPERGILAGERWERALNEAAYRCEAVLFLVSRAWLSSAWCLKEFHLAAKLNKRMFGILIEELAMADLPGELTQTWQLVNLAQGADHEPFRAVLPNRREEHVTFSKGGLQQLKSGLSKAGLDPRFFAWPPADDPERPPYRGLLSMEAEDAGIFFGREAPVIETLDRLRGLRDGAAPRLLVILGASGAGKSSFLRAGITPRLMRDDRNFLVLPVIRPERAVITGEAGLLASLEAAAKALDLKVARAEIKKRLSAGASEVLSLLASLAQRATPPKLGHEAETKAPSLVIAIDQGEELFQAEGGEEARSFLALLRDLASAAEPSLIILFTIRSDAYAVLQSEPSLKDIHQQPLNLPPVPRGAYQTIIEEPAARLKGTKRALKVDPKLTAALLEDVEAGGAKDALPLLAFTLERLYLEHGGDGDLRLDEYREIGGINGSIEAAVEQALSAADADPAVPRDRAARLAVLRRAFIPWLSGIDPETGSPRRAIARLSDIPEEARPLVKHLIAQRLLATDRSASGEETIEPAHEALLRQWGLLKGWLEEDFAQLAALEAVKRATRDWLANSKSPDWLAHNAGRLEDAERLKARPDLAAKLVPDDVDYLARCRATEIARKDKELSQAKKLTRAIAAGLVAAVLLAIVAAGFGYYGFKKADEAEAQARIAIRNEGVALSGLSMVAVSGGRPAQGVKLALAAWPRAGDDRRPAFKRIVDSLAAAASQNRQRLLLKGPDSEVTSAAFSPDGLRIVTASRNGTAQLWDARTGLQIAVLAGHTKGVNDAAFSPDGARIVTASHDGTARLWDAQTGKMVTVLEGHENFVLSASFSPDGARLVTASQDTTARLWDAKSGAEIAVLKGHDGVVNSAAFSPDGLIVVTASFDGSARLWDAKAGAEIAVKTHELPISTAAFSPDGKQIVTASWDGTAYIWDAATRTEIIALKGYTEALVSAAFSPDGTQVVTASGGGTARLWYVATGFTHVVFSGHEGGLSSAAFSPDGTRVVTASKDATVRVWDARTGTAGPVITDQKGSITFAAFSPDGTRVVTTSGDAEAQLLDAKTAAEIAVFKGHRGPIVHATFSPDGSQVATISEDKTVRLWDTKTGIGVVVLMRHRSFINSVAFSPDGTQVVTASWDGTARLWDVKTGAEIVVLKGHERIVQSAAFSPDGTQVVTGSEDGSVRLWDARSGAELALLRRQEGPFTSVAFSADGKRVLTASWDKTARVLDAKTGLEIAVLAGHVNVLNSAAFSPDGTRIVTAAQDTTARLWDAQTGMELAILVGHRHEVTSAAFTPDGQHVVTASKDKTVRLWDLADLEKGDASAIACQRLGNDTDLFDVRARYGLAEMVPICGKNAPLPVNLMQLQ